MRRLRNPVIQLFSHKGQEFRPAWFAGEKNFGNIAAPGLADGGVHVL